MSVGARLQQARQERQLSLGDVGRQTKIQSWVLEALETDRLQELMSPIYVKGFLTTYAKFLRLAPEPLLAQLPWPRSAEPEPESEALPPPTPAPIQWSWRMPTLPRVPLAWLSRLGAVAATVAIVGFIAVRHPLHWSRAAAPAAKRAKSSMAAKPAPSKAAVAKKPAAAPAAGPQLASVAPVPEAVTAKPSAPPTITILPTEPLELEVAARASTWLQIRADGKLLTQQRLQRGARERWVARKQIELVVSKPSQVDVLLNGQSLNASAITYEGRLLITHYGVTRLREGR